MSGHNKWAQIKHKKATTDAKKGKVFSKLAKAISVAARGNPDPATNVRLKTEVERAKAVNMPRENIERAIRRVSDRDAAALQEVYLEFIGPGGVGIIVAAVTDNSNRTINELRQLASKQNARMAGQGSILWMFHRSGQEFVPSTPYPLTDPVQQAQLEEFLSALDEHDDVQEVFTNADY